MKVSFKTGSFYRSFLNKSIWKALNYSIDKLSNLWRKRSLSSKSSYLFSLLEIKRLWWQEHIETLSPSQSVFSFVCLYIAYEQSSNIAAKRVLGSNSVDTKKKKNVRVLNGRLGVALFIQKPDDSFLASSF